MRVEYNMDLGWKFHKGDLPDDDARAKGVSHSVTYMNCKAGVAGGGAKKAYVDDDWEEVDLPHDYLYKCERSEECRASGGYFKTDTAWYRKVFTLDKELEGKALLLVFEGVAFDAKVYFNGSLLARSYSAYSEILVDITDRAYFDGRPNTLAVYVDGNKNEGWWYEGAGIYRHVTLYAKEMVHIEHYGIYAKPVLKKGTENDWDVEIETTLFNRSYKDDSVSVRASLWNDNEMIAESENESVSVSFCSANSVKQTLTIQDPERWDINNPKLYKVRVDVMKDGKTIDSDVVVTGFRTFYVDPEKGFFLNDRHIKIQGVANHQDHAGVGAAIPDRVQYYRIKRLKEMGANAYRQGHNTATKETIDACDTLGMLVMDENRCFEASEDNLKNLCSMVKRDRNHPSVIFYSLFNEEPLQTTEEGARIYQRLKSVVRQLDDERLVTGALNTFEPYDGSGNYMDVLGLNYGLFPGPNINIIEKTHERLPHIPIMGSENNSETATRGCYKTDREKHVLSGYDNEKVSWGTTTGEIWDFARKNDYYVGMFLWTGIDHRGEPTPFKWPTVYSCFGAMDGCGYAKPQFYINQSCFIEVPMVHLEPHWNWTEGETVKVMAITNCEEAELFLNGASLGRKTADCCAQPEWQVPFVPGNISVKAYRDGKVVCEDVRYTAREPVAIQLQSDWNKVNDDGQDVIILNCSVVDKEGHELATADNLLQFEVEGDAILLGVGNGDPNSHAPEWIPERKLFAGKCQAIIRVLPKAKSLRIRVYGERLEEAIYEPEIIKVEEPKYIMSTKNDILYGVSQSSVTKERPDPLMHLEEHDVNTFAVVEFLWDFYQREFSSGWRIYRVTPIITHEKMILSFADVRCTSMEVYVDGKLIYQNGESLSGEVNCPFETEKGKQVDIRILMSGDNPDGNGIRKCIRLLEDKDNK